MTKWEVKVWAQKYGGYRPCDRRTWCVKAILGLAPYHGPQSGFLNLEVPEEWLDEITAKEAEEFMQRVMHGFELVIAGAVRMAYDQTRQEIMNAARRWGEYYVEHKAHGDEPEDE